MSKILMVASEAAPYAKTGGLADVIGALPKALASRGEQVAVVLPWYSVAGRYPDSTPRVAHDLAVWLGATQYLVHIRRHDADGVTFFFIEEPNLFGREALYGAGDADYPDNHIRFAVFCNAVAGLIRWIWRPEIIHCHDWQTGLIGPLLRHRFAGDPTFYGLKLVFTIHNLGYKGLYPPESLPDMGLDGSLFRPESVEFHGRVSLLKAGIVYADAITTVSPTYAREIQTPKLGFGLEGLLTTRSSVLTGIINGVDYEHWSPEHDALIPQRYSAGDISGKRECKRALLAEFGLPADDLGTPLLGVVSRFVTQKGFDIITAAGEAIAAEDLRLVAFGTGEPQYEEALLSLAARYPDKVAVRIGFDNGLAHRIEAGSDMFLMPSMYEPCGLNQIYSLRYGTLPIVRATGGLADTVDDETGFRFTDYTPEALVKAIRAALRAWADRKRWQAMMQTAMKRDHSWEASAAQYIELYQRVSG